jgi:hypothetical protein
MRLYIPMTTPLDVLSIFTSWKSAGTEPLPNRRLPAPRTTENPQAKLIHQIVRKQRLNKLAAAMDLQEQTILFLEACYYLGCNVASDGHGIVPIQCLQFRRGDDFGEIVHRVVVGRVGGEHMPPNRTSWGSTIASLPTSVITSSQYGSGPTAAVKPAGPIFLRHLGGLHDAVQRHERQNGEFSHAQSPPILSRTTD